MTRPVRGLLWWILGQCAALALVARSWLTPALTVSLLMIRWQLTRDTASAPQKDAASEPSPRALRWLVATIMTLGVTPALIQLPDCISQGEWWEVMSFLLTQSCLVVQVYDAGRDRWLACTPVRDWVCGWVVIYCSLNRPLEFDQRGEAILIASVLMAIFASSAQSGWWSGGGKPGLSRWRPTVALAIAFVLPWPIGWQITRQMQLAQRWIAEQFELNVGPVRAARNYVRIGNLRAILDEQTSDPMQVALRVFSPYAPGYLRGRVHDQFVRGQWTSGTNGRVPRRDRVQQHRLQRPLPQPPLGIPPARDDFQLFELSPQGRPPWTVLEIWNDPARGEQFFLPLQTCYVRGRGDFVAIDLNGTLRTGISFSQPYTAFVPRTPPPVRLSERDRQRWLTPLADLDPRVADLAREVGQNCTTPREKIDAVVDFFHQNFRYSLEGTTIPDRGNALNHFLLERPAAHCEFFASGAVALLRQLDVPARYVTGYVVREASEYEEYWIARNRNAHAWAEAYDRDVQRWVIVEATPGADDESSLGVLRGRSPTNAAAQPLSEVWQLGQMWMTPRWRQIWLHQLWRWLRAPLFGAVFLGGMMLVVTRRHALRTGLRRLTARQWICPRSPEEVELRRWNRRLRKLQLVRAPQETLHRFAARVEAHTPPVPWQTTAAEFLRDFAVHRYAPRFHDAADNRSLSRPPSNAPASPTHPRHVGHSDHLSAHLTSTNHRANRFRNRQP